MPSPKASSDDFHDTQTLYAPHLEHKTSWQAQARMLILDLMNRILTYPRDSQRGFFQRAFGDREGGQRDVREVER